MLSDLLLSITGKSHENINPYKYFLAQHPANPIIRRIQIQMPFSKMFQIVQFNRVGWKRSRSVHTFTNSATGINYIYTFHQITY